MLEQEGQRVSKFMRQAKLVAAGFLNEIGILILPTGFQDFPKEDLGFLSSMACRGHQKNSMDTKHCFLTVTL